MKTWEKLYEVKFVNKDEHLCVMGSPGATTSNRVFIKQSDINDFTSFAGGIISMEFVGYVGDSK